MSETCDRARICCAISTVLRREGIVGAVRNWAPQSLAANKREEEKKRGHSRRRRRKKRTDRKSNETRAYTLTTHTKGKENAAATV